MAAYKYFHKQHQAMIEELNKGARGRNLDLGAALFNKYQSVIYLLKLYVGISLPLKMHYKRI